MDFNDMAEDAKSSVLDSIREKPHVVAAVAGILVLFLIAMIILASQTSTKKTRPSKQAEFQAKAGVLIPDPPNVESAYYQYRSTPEKWDAGESQEFFTSPDDSAMNALEKANDSIADDILEAVP